MTQQVLHTDRLRLVPLSDEHLEREIELDAVSIAVGFAGVAMIWLASAVLTAVVLRRSATPSHGVT